MVPRWNFCVTGHWQPSLKRHKLDNKAGGTGLSGRSQQNFGIVAPLDYDASRFVILNLCLAAVVQDPRHPFLAPILFHSLLNSA